MIPVGQIWDNIMDAVNLHGSETKTLIQRLTQKHYYRIVEKTDWQALRRVQAVTFATTDTNGQILNADMVGIMSVVSEVDGSERIYRPCLEQQRYFDQTRYRWFHPQTATSVFQEGVPAGTSGGLTIAQDATALSPTLTTGAAGEYIQIGKEPGVYHLASTTALTNNYRGPRQENVYFCVRPRSTRYIFLIDDSGDAYGDTVQVYHWIYPEPLYRDWQVPLLPGHRALELSVIIDFLTMHDKKDRRAAGFKAEMEDPVTGAGAMSDMIEQNPKWVTPAIPRGKQSQRAFFGRRRENE